jgi:hypothetical protein
MAVVNSPSGIYVITIFIEGPPDAKSSWHGEADTSIRAISGAVWRHYHPNDKWSPPAGADKFW